MFGCAAGLDRVATIRRIWCTRTLGARRSVEADEEAQEHERQAALNQAVRREVNERRLGGGEDAEVEFVCECSDPACEELVSLTIGECEFIRRVPTRLVVRPGHVNHENERVIMEEPGRFAVVEKFGPAGDVVAHLDPRSEGRNRR
jgi:hypothetical protein